MGRYALIDVPSNLGLRPSGVEQLPRALRDAGLAERLRARDAGQVEPSAPYDPRRATETGLLNGPALRTDALRLAARVAAVLRDDDIPVVLAGDCSVLLGSLLGVRLARRGQRRAERIGLLFVDGHVDFYRPDESPTGEVADMDLALATGHGPEVLAELIEGDPLVRGQDVVAVGARDAEERERAGAQEIRDTDIRLFELEDVRARGIDPVATEATQYLSSSQLAGFWMHLDADVLDDAIMPAVDYRQPGGFATDELLVLLRSAVRTGRLAGMSISIYNPSLDADGSAARRLVECVAEGIAVEGDPDPADASG